MTNCLIRMLFIRRDSNWDKPEKGLKVVICPQGFILNLQRRSWSIFSIIKFYKLQVMNVRYIIYQNYSHCSLWNSFFVEKIVLSMNVKADTYTISKRYLQHSSFCNAFVVDNEWVLMHVERFSMLIKIHPFSILLFVSDIM